MDKRPEPPPWGRLITQALRKSGLSARKAAGLAGLSEGRWRQITSGYQNVGAGVYAPVRGPAETIARMAQVVRVTPEQLEEAGRPDAAEALRGVQAPEPERPPVREPDELDQWLERDPEARAALRVVLRRMRGEPPDQPDSPSRDKDVG